MARVFNLEATDMGENQGEIAEKCLELVADKNFSSEEEFYENEGQLIAKACDELGWHSVPQTGGLIANWDTPTGDFE